MSALHCFETHDAQGWPVKDMRVSVSHWGLMHLGYITDWQTAWPEAFEMHRVTTLPRRWPYHGVHAG